MLLKDFPDYFASYKVYEVVKDTMRNYAREKDIDKMICQLSAREAEPSDFLRHLSVISKRFLNVSKASRMILAIRSNLAELISVDIEPKEVEFAKNKKGFLKIYVENKLDGTFKYKVGIQQMDRKYTALIHNPVKNFSLTKLVKSAIIEPGKMHAFKFILKPEVFGIDDLYELKKDNKIKFTLGIQIAVDGVDGMKTKIKKKVVTVLKHRL